ncbi:MAG: permease [Rhodospirillales bacterium]|nr:permease [Alphaproteobacteria bacterium]USO04626.1 MAG: permease [Rhodospirillales bacterium]
MARTRRRYDLPLEGGEGSGFLRLLIALMTLLAVLGLSASFVLSEMTQRWSSGLEGRLSVEIPAEDSNGQIMDAEKVKDMTQKAAQIFETHPAVSGVEIMSDAEIRDLLSPWLGKDLAMGNIPLPGLISVHLQEGAEVDLDALQERLQKINGAARIDTHESWLKDVLQFTGALQFAAMALTLIIGATTIAAVAGGVRSQTAVHKDALELLHLMGASDSYISRQIQRHILILAFQGALAGAAAGGILLLLIGWFSVETQASLLPEFSLSLLQKTELALIPALVAFLAMLTARRTLLRTLAQMP